LARNVYFAILRQKFLEEIEQGPNFTYSLAGNSRYIPLFGTIAQKLFNVGNSNFAQPYELHANCQIQNYTFVDRGIKMYLHISEHRIYDNWSHDNNMNIPMVNVLTGETYCYTQLCHVVLFM
jgi:hypothetical protein